MLGALALCLALALTADDELERLASSGQWQALRALVDGRLEQDPADAVARYWLGREQLEQAWGLLDGDRMARDIGRAVLERAIDHLGKALDGGVPEAADWWLQARFSRWQLLQAEPDDAVGDALCSDLEREWHDQSRAMAAFLRGLAAKLREDEQALPWFERAVQADPERSAFALEWSRELAAAGDREGAMAAWTTARRASDWELTELLAVLLNALPARDDAERRLVWLDELAQVPALSDDAQLAWHRAHTLALLDRLAEAADAFARGTRGRTEVMDRAEASYMWSLDRPADALELLFGRARDQYWDCLDDAVSIADGLAIARRFEEALAAYETALSIEPRHERALWHRALASWHSGRDDQATAAWADLIERFPGRSDIVNDAALAAWGVGDYALVQQRLEQAVTWPGSRDAQENLAVLLLSEGSLDEERAQQLLQGVLEQEPERDRSLLYRFRAHCLALSGQP
jgi:tetratricopeptide (TPR) repeat protein